MVLENVTVEIENSGYNLINHTNKIIAACKQALEDGFQFGSDVPPMVSALIAEFPGILADAGQIKSGLEADKLLFAKGCNLAAYNTVEIFTAKK